MPDPGVAMNATYETMEHSYDNEGHDNDYGDVHRINHYYRSSIALSSLRGNAGLGEMGVKRNSLKPIEGSRRSTHGPSPSSVHLPDIEWDTKHLAFNWDSFSSKKPHRKKYLDKLDGVRYMKPATDYLWTQQNSKHSSFKDILSESLERQYSFYGANGRGASKKIDPAGEHKTNTHTSAIEGKERGLGRRASDAQSGLLKREPSKYENFLPNASVNNPLARFEDTTEKLSKKKRVEFADKEPTILGLAKKSRAKKLQQTSSHSEQPKKSILKRGFDDPYRAPAFHLPSISRTTTPTTKVATRKRERKKQSLTFNCSNEFAEAYLDSPFE